MSLYNETSERRCADRFPIERELRFKVLSRTHNEDTGMGKTVNMSSNGILFTTDHRVPHGKSVELSVSWPAQLNSAVPLKFVARGRVVRTEDGRAAIEVQHTEFRTQSTHAH